MKTIKFLYKKISSFFVNLFGCSKTKRQTATTPAVSGKKKTGRPANSRKKTKHSR